MNPSPIPKYDNPRLHESECLYLFGAGREKKIYAIPPHTKVVSLAFDDVPFEIEHMEGRRCRYVERKMFILTSLSTERQALSAISARIQVTALNEGCARRRTADAY